MTIHKSNKQSHIEIVLDPNLLSTNIIYYFNLPKIIIAANNPFIFRTSHKINT
uniref:Uncharacterized protein n=1 Tax=Anguilla anguilla TaxID=7936 RepID=A0A0E9RJ62_ANGAN